MAEPPHDSKLLAEPASCIPRISPVGRFCSNFLHVLQYLITPDVLSSLKKFLKGVYTKKFLKINKTFLLKTALKIIMKFKYFSEL